MTQEQKSQQFVKSFKILNDINFDLLVEAITSIKTPDGVEVTAPEIIKEFCNNCESKLINEIQTGLGNIRTQAQIKPLKVEATEEQIKKGAPATYEIPVTFDNSNFFV
jgi:LEA14-like dessication related protein